MAFSAWINMGSDAKGESLDKDHTDWIDITWCGHQIVQPQASTRTIGGGTVNQAEHGDFQFRKVIDKSTAKLYELVCNGKHLDKATVEFAKPIGGKPTKYMVIEMKNVVVSGITMDAGGGGPAIENTTGSRQSWSGGGAGSGKGLLTYDRVGGDYPTETVTLSYDAISWTYTQVDASGKSKGNVAANWSRASGVSA
jgi:type VI secretion system secreted protein Hcp